MKNTISQAMLAVLLAFALAGGAAAQTDLSCGNSVRSEPIVLWDVTGTDFAGQVIHGTLTVYNNGNASVSSFQTGDVRSATVGPQAARTLRQALVNAGGMALCDGDPATDMPLTTVTVLGATPDARAHSFSYWIAADEYARIQALIEDFLGEYFKGFSLY